jgi:hypothetical protein
MDFSTRRLPSFARLSGRLPSLRTRGSPPTDTATALIWMGAALAGSKAAGLLSRRSAGSPFPSTPAKRATRMAAWSSALLSASVLADAGIEHFRGNYNNRAMYVAPAAAGVGIAAALGLGNRRVRQAALASVTAIGVVGLGFHLYNILKRPGGSNWHNLFYAAPFGAPGALALSGLLGLQALELDRPGTAAEDERRGLRLALLTSSAIAGTVGEVALLHFRGAFQNPGMLLPVTIPPAAAAALAAAAQRPSQSRKTVARSLLGAMAVMGVAGVGFHAFGVSRNMGGWRNWTQNLVVGPPLSAPPSFAGLALAGLAALTLLPTRQRR